MRTLSADKVSHKGLRELQPNRELALLLCCARIYLNTCPIHMLTQALSRDMDWNKFIEHAISHNLLHVVKKVLDQHGKDLVQEQVRTRLGSLCFENSTRSLRQSAALIKLIRLFTDHHIPAIPFKGPALSQMLYQTYDARIFGDLDILVSPKDAIGAKNLLLSNGFHTDVQIPESQESAYVQKGNFFHIFNPSGNVNIDLHWELSGRYTQKPLFFEVLTPYTQSIKLCGHSCPILGNEDTLIHLCIHGSRHCWDKLEMLFAIALLVKQYKHSIIWDAVLKKAKRLGAKKMLFLSLALASHLFHISLPHGIQKEITQANLKFLSQQILTKTYFNQINFIESVAWRFSPFHFLVRDNILDAITYASRLLFQPTIAEWISCPLPDRLLLLYHIIRPCRLIKEYWEAY